MCINTVNNDNQKSLNAKILVASYAVMSRSSTIFLISQRSSKDRVAIPDIICLLNISFCLPKAVSSRVICFSIRLNYLSSLSLLHGSCTKLFLSFTSYHHHNLSAFVLRFPGSSPSLYLNKISKSFARKSFSDFSSKGNALS
jgi:hypothetical protein